MGGEDRGKAMSASLVRAGRSLGVSPPDMMRVSRAHALAMEPRVAALDDDHHPLYLHPGRSALVLLRDTACRDGAVLAAAVLTESEDDVFRIPLERVRSELDEDVAELVAAVPRPRSDTLAETLVTASEAVRLVALAERLDHLRHAHLRGADRAWMEAVFATAEEAYRPVAHRTHPRLAQRYDHWARTFARRLARDA